MKAVTKYDTKVSEYNIVVCCNYKNSKPNIVNWITTNVDFIKLKSDVGVWKIKQLKNN